jgi:hypothetical protein
MGASGSILINKQVYISFDTSCCEKIINTCIYEINKLQFNIINNKDTHFVSDNYRIVENNIIQSNYIIIFISKETLKSNKQAFDIQIALENNKSVIYLIADKDYLPLFNTGIKLFIGNKLWYPCYDAPSVNYSLSKIKQQLVLH